MPVSISPKQSWVGRVDAVHEQTFSASLVSPDEPDEIDAAEFEIEEIALADRHRLRPGALFDWVIGYRDEPHGQRLGVSVITFHEPVPALVPPPNPSSLAHGPRRPPDTPRSVGPGR